MQIHSANLELLIDEKTTALIMASFGHIAVAITAARLGRPVPQGRMQMAISVILWSALSLLPDLDVIGFSFGIGYADTWGHRGATHSLAFSIALGVLVAIVAKIWEVPFLRTAILAACVVASHAILDSFTNGGLGCALLWPFDDTRYFAPWNPIPVAPIGKAFFSIRGLSVIAFEMVIFLPLVIFGVWTRKT